MPISFDNLRNAINRAAKESKLQQPTPAPESIEEAKKKKKKRRVYATAFAPLFVHNNLGTPATPGSYVASAGIGTGSAGASTGGAAATGGTGGVVGSSYVPPSRTRVLHELKKAMGLLEYNPGTGAAASSTVGYAVPNPLMVAPRMGGPSLSGPGFNGPQSSDQPGGGVYDFARSPGLGFRSEQAWRVWEAALEIMSRDKTLPTGAILQAALFRSSVKLPDMDPSEVRLIEMGIQWYLNNEPSKANPADPAFAPIR